MVSTTGKVYHGFILCQLANKVPFGDNVGSAILSSAVDYDVFRKGHNNATGFLLPLLPIPTEAVRNEKLDSLTRTKILECHNRESLPELYILSTLVIGP
jgi:hypothetical protein